MSDGEIVKLEDGSLWRVDDTDTVDSALWLPTTDIAQSPAAAHVSPCASALHHIFPIDIGSERRPWKPPASRCKQILASNFTGDQFGGVRTVGYALLRDEGEEK
jgi:hypothetical protein